MHYEELETLVSYHNKYVLLTPKKNICCTCRTSRHI